ncbi:MAG: choice-of-anchor D domain-containing protein [Candidatus Binatus sp.]
MKESWGKVRIGTIAILGAVAFAISALTSMTAPRVVQAQLPQPSPVHQPPSRPVGAPAWQPGPQPVAPSSASATVPGGVGVTSGVWTPLNDQPYLNNPAFSPNSMFLLTDGTVLAQDGNLTAVGWWKLTPDNTGSYINGTWSQVASPGPCPNGFPGASADTVYSPLYYASAVLPDGRFVLIGGEYNYNYDYLLHDGSGEVETDQGAIYDPVANIWTCLAPPSGWKEIGDAQSVVLPDGTFMVAHIFDNQVATFNAATNSFNSPFTPAGKTSADYRNSEEGWELLPNGTVLTLEIWNLSESTDAPTPALTYSPASQTWSSVGSAPDPLVNLDIEPGSESPYYEIGPALLRPDGTVFAEGATQFNDIYNTNTGTWTSGPMFPSVSGQQVEAMDAPSALLPDGNVLLSASPTNYSPPTSFFEFDGTSLTQVANPAFVEACASFDGRLLLLPTGQVMYTNCYSGYVTIYTPAGTPNPSWAPTITNSPSQITAGGANYQITGTQFNGLSQAVSYGDDYQAATNYPLVRITNNATGHVFYARTHGHSTMAVATGSTSVSTQFDVPADLEPGASTLVVVANGIASQPVAVNMSSPTATPTASATPTATSSGGGTPTPTPTATPTSGGSATPTATATRTATATATATASATATLTATPTSTPTSEPGTMTIKPSSVAFGTKDTVGKASKPKKLTIKNTSSKSSKISVMISGETAAPPFAVTSQCTTTLAPGKSCKVLVTFTPPDTSSHEGMLTVNDNATGAAQTVPLSGTGKAPK